MFRGIGNFIHFPRNRDFRGKGTFEEWGYNRSSSTDNMMKMMTMMMLMQGGSMDMGALKGLLGGSKSLPAAAADLHEA
uniref:Uncharacterized protein n=1 Tax=Romanomermis culicivorax TaxID=13658 RepID=A0A915J208_ROMCU